MPLILVCVELRLQDGSPDDYLFTVLNGGCSQELFDKIVKEVEKKLKQKLFKTCFIQLFCLIRDLEPLVLESLRN